MQSFIIQTDMGDDVKGHGGSRNRTVDLWNKH
jgi:hypothetical protein